MHTANGTARASLKSAAVDILSWEVQDRFNTLRDNLRKLLDDLDDAENAVTEAIFNDDLDRVCGFLVRSSNAMGSLRSVLWTAGHVIECVETGALDLI